MTSNGNLVNGNGQGTKCTSTTANHSSKITDEALQKTEALQSLFEEFEKISDRITNVKHQIEKTNTTAKKEKQDVTNLFQQLETKLHETRKKCLSKYNEINDKRKKELNSHLKHLKDYKNNLNNLKKVKFGF